MAPRPDILLDDDSWARWVPGVNPWVNTAERGPEVARYLFGGEVEAAEIPVPAGLALDEQTNVEETRGGLHLFELHFASYGSGMLSSLLLIAGLVGAAVLVWKLCTCSGMCRPMHTWMCCCCDPQRHVASPPPPFHGPSAVWSAQQPGDVSLPRYLVHHPSAPVATVSPHIQEVVDGVVQSLEACPDKRPRV